MLEKTSMLQAEVSYSKNYENTYFKNLIMFSSKGKRKVKNGDALQMNFLRGSIFHVL